MRSLLAVAALVGAALPGALAVTTETGITNVAPLVTSVSLSGLVGGALSPTAGATASTTATITVTDANGYQDLQSVTFTLRRPDGTTHTATTAASFVSGTLTTATYTAALSLTFHDAPGTGAQTYKLDVTATDQTGATGTSLAAATFNYHELAALTTGTSLTFGNSLAPGATSATQALVVTNRGNVRLDTLVAGTPLANATTGVTLPVGSIRWSLDSGMTGPTALALSASTAEAFDLPPGAASSSSMYWSLAAPDGASQWIPQGTYTGTLTVGAVKG